ncbi:hypothetical protein HanRHA438_Chr09g0387761 [Helianthus annuus]|nr:hypothetical protein HanRHA438_Chr09g0387761 [Helianthus annuus]
MFMGRTCHWATGVWAGSHKRRLHILANHTHTSRTRCPVAQADLAAQEDQTAQEVPSRTRTSESHMLYVCLNCWAEW